MFSWKRFAGPTSFVVVASVFTVLLITVATLGYVHNNNTRQASCEATLSSFGAIQDVALAGIRPVPQGLPEDTPAGLQASFAKQIAATVAENAKRMQVLEETERAARVLEKSDFCN